MGLESLAASAPEQVLIHDAARPLVSAEIIDRVIDALERFPAALPVMPVVDTLKQLADAEVVGEVDRRGLGRAQTPQGFRFEAILEAHRTVEGIGYTDDTAIAAAAGLPVAWVAGEDRNLKLTIPEDHQMAERLLRRRTPVADGLGFDVHAFAPDRPLVLCGVRIPHEFGLAGHSDADVGVPRRHRRHPGHDRGRRHRQPLPAERRTVARRGLGRLPAACGRTARRQGRADRACRRGHRLRAAEDRPVPRGDGRRAAEMLGIPADRIRIKATTSERMGFTGRGEGIAAQAVVSVAMGG